MFPLLRTTHLASARLPRIFGSITPVFGPVPRLCRTYNHAPNLTTQTTITDQVTGEVITLSDPNHPEWGAYQNPPVQLAQDKDPYGKYDIPQLRRNVNDPLHIDEDLYDIWSPDYYQPVSDGTALKHNAVFFSLFFGLAAAVAFFELAPEKPAMPRSFPYNGLAESLGSGSEKDAFLYQVRPDTTAAQLGVLAADADVDAQREAYLRDNAVFIGR